MERGLSKKSESQKDCDLCDASAHHHPHCFCQPHLLACRQRSTRSHLDLIAFNRPTDVFQCIPSTLTTLQNESPTDNRIQPSTSSSLFPLTSSHQHRASQDPPNKSRPSLHIHRITHLGQCLSGHFLLFPVLLFSIYFSRLRAYGLFGL
jgi:hypothetical protein